jgi:hypothetical protein
VSQAEAGITISNVSTEGGNDLQPMPAVAHEDRPLLKRGDRPTLADWALCRQALSKPSRSQAGVQPPSLPLRNRLDRAGRLFAPIFTNQTPVRQE